MANKDPIKLNQAGTLTRGINENQPDFQNELMYTDQTVNVTSGIVEGIGPRYGFAPIPGHMDQEAAASGALAGLMLSENGFVGSSLASTCDRVGIFGIVALSFGGPGASLSTISTYYAYLISYTTLSASGVLFDIVIGCTTPTSSPFTIAQSPNIYAGLAQPGASNGTSVADGTLDIEMLNNIAGNTVFSYFQSGAATFASYTPFSISGSDISMNWLLGGVPGTAQGGATTAPNLALGSTNFSGTPTFAAINCGFPSAFNYGKFSPNNRNVKVYALTSLADANMDYALSFTPTTSIFLPTYLDTASASITTINLSGITATKTTSGTNYAATTAALYNDPSVTTNSAMQGVLAAVNGKPYCVLVQDWYRNSIGSLSQYVDLVNLPLAPSVCKSAGYTQDGATTPTAFSFWPSFVTGTALSSSNRVALGGAGTGLLRANTIYEFTYSIYSKRLNTESNVGAPVRIQTGTNDFVNIQLFTSDAYGGGHQNIAGYMLGNSGISIIPWPGSQLGGDIQTLNNPLHMNYLEYRFYYRQLGSQEWLPALNIDASQFWFYTYWKPLAACSSAVAGLPGGDPGDVIDFSPLPQGNYDCVVMYKNRAFWFTSSSVVFSLINNIFCYPQRNSAACPIGSFRGALVQAYYGQANQNARIVVFSTEGTYVGAFTGNQVQVPLTLDSTSGTISYPLDGSDFELNAWTSVTAFSYRSAVVAEGLLIFWGPQGIFLDDGVNPIQRISVPLEPQIFNLYDASQTDAIHCEYNDTTKEIWWFYAPQTADATYPTHGICYNKLKNSWLYGKFRGQIDAVSTLHVDNAEATAGSRLVAYSRASASSSIQRAYYFDQNNLAADIFPGQELMAKIVSYISPTQMQLTLAAGHSTGTIAPGDLIAVQQLQAYTLGAIPTGNDFIASVAAVSGANITLNMPPGGSLGSTTVVFPHNYQYLPIWHAAGTNGAITGLGINAFPYTLDTKFWVPNGMSYWGYWFYIHLVYKLYDLLPIKVPLTQTFAYQSPVSGVGGSDILTLINNSANNCQIYHPLEPGEMSMEGQGIKMTFSGIQLASSWVLQFLESMSEVKDGNQLKIFNG